MKPEVYGLFLGESGVNKVLILGNSNIANKRVIPALLLIPSIESIEIATLTSSPLLGGKITKVYNSYEDAIKNFDGDLVYISLSNHLHDKYLKMSIDNNLNCVVDKPAILNPDTLDYLKLNNTENKIIAESVVFMEHPAWSSLINKMDGSSNIFRVLGTFMIPELDKTNFRMNKEFFGGALNDMGAYAMGMGRWVWNSSPKDIKIGNVETDQGLIKSFSFIADYGSNRISMGSFGFGYEYMNKVTMIGKNSWGEFDRVFSLPSDLNISINGKKNNNVWKIDVQKDDSFKVFLEKILNDINSNKTGNWFNKVLDTYEDHSSLSNEIKKWRDK